MKRELAELMDAYLAGELGGAELERLDELLRNHPEASRAFYAQGKIDAALREIMSGDPRDRAIRSSVMACLRGKPSRAFRRETIERITSMNQCAEKKPVARARSRRRPRQNRTRWWPVAVTAAAAAAVLVIALLAGNQGRPVVNEVAAHVTELSGNTRLVSSGRSVPVKPGMQLCSGDRVITGPDGRASIRFSDGTVVWLSAGGDLRVRLQRSPGAIARLVALGSGKIEVDVAHQEGGRSFAATTPQARVEVRGTRFELFSDDESTRLDVLEGTVRLAKRDDASTILVEAGYSAIAAPGVALKAVPSSKKVALKEAAPGGEKKPGPGKNPAGTEDRKVLWRDSFDDLSPWLITEWRKPGGIAFESGGDKSRTPPGSLRIRYDYPGLPAVPGTNVDRWLANQRSVERKLTIPEGATHLRMWIKVLAAGDEAQMSLWLHHRERKWGWGDTLKIGSMKGDWTCYEVDLKNMPEYWHNDTGGARGQDVPPMPFEEISGLELGLNITSVDILIDDIEFVRKGSGDLEF